MFAYCNNNSVNFEDNSGGIPTYSVHAADSGKISDYYYVHYVLLKSSKYSEAAWSTASPEEKKELLNDFYNDIANRMNVPTATDLNFYYQEPEGGYITNGYYQHKLATVSINEYGIYNYSNSKSYEVFSTIIHELRHAYQYYSTEKYGIYGFHNPNGVPAGTLKAWDQNIYNYIPSSPDYNSYYNQPIEVDARAFAGQ